MDLQVFIDSVIQEKYQGVVLDDFVIEEMRNDLMGRLTTFISLKVMTELAQKDPTLLGKFQSLATGDTDPKEVQDFVNAHIDDGAVFLAKILNDFRILYLGLDKS